MDNEFKQGVAAEETNCQQSIKEMEQQLKNGWIKDKPYVFVSYASNDKEQVFEMVLELRKRGINVYIDVELQENLSQNWLTNIRTRLFDYDCKGMISFISMDFMRSYACLIEQLVCTSQDLIDQKGKALTNFFIVLDKDMGTVQNIYGKIYGEEQKKSQQQLVDIQTEEKSFLQEVMENNKEICMDLQWTSKGVAGEIDKIQTRHDVVVKMYKYIFKEKSVSLQPFESAEACAELLFNNIVNDKNTTIYMEPLPELEYSDKIWYSLEDLLHKGTCENIQNQYITNIQAYFKNHRDWRIGEQRNTFNLLKEFVRNQLRLEGADRYINEILNDKHKKHPFIIETKDIDDHGGRSYSKLESPYEKYAMDAQGSAYSYLKKLRDRVKELGITDLSDVQIGIDKEIDFTRKNSGKKKKENG